MKKKKSKRKKSIFSAKSRELRQVLYTHKAIFLLNYKEILYNEADLDSSVPSVIKYILQEHSYMFSVEMLKV